MHSDPKQEPYQLMLAPMSAFCHLLNDANFDALDALRAFSEERGHTVLELAFASLKAGMSQPQTTLLRGLRSRRGC